MTVGKFGWSGLELPKSSCCSSLSRCAGPLLELRDVKRTRNLGCKLYSGVRIPNSFAPFNCFVLEVPGLIFFYLGIVLNYCQYGVLYLGSYYNTGPHINFTHFGNSNLGKLPHIPIYTSIGHVVAKTPQ